MLLSQQKVSVVLSEHALPPASQWSDGSGAVPAPKAERVSAQRFAAAGDVLLFVVDLFALRGAGAEREAAEAALWRDVARSWPQERPLGDGGNRSTPSQPCQRCG